MIRQTPVGRHGLSQAQLVRDLARPYRGWLVVILTAMVVETLAGLAGPWPLKMVIDDVVGHRTMPTWAASVLGSALAFRPFALAGVAAALMVLLAVAGGVASYVDNFYTESVGQWVGNDLRLRIYEHLESLSFTYYDTHETGVLLSTMTDDVSTVQDFVSSSALGILVDVTTIVGMLGLMFWLDWSFTLLIVAVTPLLVLAISRFRRSVKNAMRDVRRRESDVMGVVQTSLQSMRTVQALSAQDFEEERVAAASRAAVDAALHARRIKSLLSPSVALVVAGCNAVVLWRGADGVLTGVMTVGSLTVFLAYLARFFKPVQDLAKITTAVAQTHVALDRIAGILDIDTTVQERVDAREPTALQGAIRFEHVAFAYNVGAPVLRDVTLAIPAGSFVGVVGQTGSGKSTIASLVPRFYDPTAGRILIDGVDVRDLTLRGLRRQIGLVLQETVLFRGTIRDNIAYGRHDATDAEIVTAARLANAEEFIAKLPDGYQARVGERGATLSGGQRQRIGIARAFIRDAPILILDEPTASLDPESEVLVIDSLRRLMKDRTVIMITHRLDTLHDAQMIVVLHDGLVAEKGTHDALLSRNGIYASLYFATPRAPSRTETAWHAR